MLEPAQVLAQAGRTHSLPSSSWADWSTPLGDHAGACNRAPVRKLDADANQRGGA